MSHKYGADSKSKSDIHKIYGVVGTGEFSWGAVKDIVEGNQRLYTITKVIIDTKKRTQTGCKIYKLNSGFIPKVDLHSGEINAGTLALTISIAAVTILIGYLMMSNLEIVTAPSITHSVLSASGDVILGGFGNAASYLAFGLFVMAAVFIVGIIASIMGRGE